MKVEVTPPLPNNLFPARIEVFLEMIYIIFFLSAAGWISLFLAPINFRKCWIFARSCAVIMAVLCMVNFVLAVNQIGLAFFTDWFVFKSFFESKIGVFIVLEVALAFQLFFGSWQVEDSKLHAISHLRLLPFLFLVCVLPPLGLITHMMMRDCQKLKIANNRV